MMLPTIILRIERWKFNKDYGVYVSTQGNFKDRHKRRLPIKINQGGYCAVKTESGWILCHRLVMFTWRPIPNAENLTVDHLNHNKRDNSVENLEWVTQEENLRRAERDLITIQGHKVSKKSVSNLQTAKTHHFKCLTTGDEFEDGIVAAAWARARANQTNDGSSAEASAKHLVAACKKDGRWYGMQWEMFSR